MAERFRPTPAFQELGMGVNSVFSRFKAPEGMEDDPAYTVSAQRGIQQARDAEFAQAEQRRLMDMRAAEDRAIQGIRDDPDDIPNVFARNPELVRSPSFGQFEQVRRSVIPSRAQQTLAPSLRLKLDSADRTTFDEVLDQTGNAMEAYDAAQNKGAQERDYADMVKSGVPLTEVDRFRSAGKRPSPIEKESLIRQHTVKSQDHPMKGAYDLAVKDLFENWADAEGKTFTSQPVDAQAKMIQNLRRGYGLDPTPEIPKPAASSAVSSTLPTEAPAQAAPDLSSVHYSELPATVQAAPQVAAAPSQEQAQAAQQWEQAKRGIEKDIGQIVPNETFPGTTINKQERLARAIVDNEMVPVQEEVLPEFRSLVVNGRVPPWVPILTQLRKSGVAFTEPGNLRIGNQAVSYPEVIQAWGKEIDDKRVARERQAAQAAALPADSKAKAAAVWQNMVGSAVPPSFQ